MKGYRGERPFRPVYAAAALSLAYLLLVRFLPSRAPAAGAEMTEASLLMAQATAAVRDCRERRGVPLDLEADPNGTGLIGLERSTITTSLGSLEAKRTTTNPNFAALIVSLFRQTGVKRGEAVAIGASSSFPALIVATLAAAEVMGVEPLVISSLGASEYGANIPGFDWTDMEYCLRAAGVLDVRPVARAIGGDEDVGRDMEPEGRALLESRIRASDVPFIAEPDLERNVALRMELYQKSAERKPIKAFVNIGGSWANIGTDAEVLKLEPGLARGVFIPPPAGRGVLQAMAAARIPIIHLLNIKGLCKRYGIPWDPRPLPRPGEGRLDRGFAAGTPARPVWSALYVLGIVLLLAFGRRSL